MGTCDRFKFFIVDNDQFCLSMYEKHLQNLNYDDIHTFDNGNDCLDNLARQPDIIFLDLDMGYLKCMEVLKKIKLINPGIYVVFISGNDDMETAASSVRYGAFDYIVKGTGEANSIKNVIEKIAAVKKLFKSEIRAFGY